jgi:hypothetical protein
MYSRFGRERRSMGRASETFAHDMPLGRGNSAASARQRVNAAVILSKRKTSTMQLRRNPMYKTMFTAQISRPLGIALIAGTALGFVSVPARAADQIQPPPYVVAGMNGVGLAVVWDEAAIRKALPPGIEPVKGITGGINIYSAERGYAIGPYSAAYFYVDIEGFDSPDGTKGRWMLAGVYGPQTKTSAALKTYYGLPVRPGTSRSEPSADGKRAIATMNGQDFVTTEIKSVPGSCEAAAILLNYVSMSSETERVMVNKIPVVGDFCKAEPVSAKVTAPSGDPFSAYPISKVVGANEFRNGAASFTVPQPAGK